MATTEDALAPAAVGRRERKKEATREALVAAAVSLFSERGFDATTVDDIADAVDVSARTFHRYFSSKEDVLFSDAVERLRRFEEALGNRPPDEDVLDSIRAAVHELGESFLARPALERARQQLLENSNVLRAHGLRHSDEWARLIARHTATRLGIPPDDPLPELLGACTVAVLRAARKRAEGPKTNLRREIDRGFELVAHLADATTTARRQTK
jgi:AcrR family transcriptional regulator